LNSNNLTEQAFTIKKSDRRKQKKHTSFVIWLTGYSGAGKSTLANGIDKCLFEKNIHSYVLDGDNVRHGLNGDLQFSDADRKENIRRVGEVSKLFVDAGIVVIAAFISPFREDRDEVRKIIHPDHFIELFVDTSIQECERRDTKGLYQKARNGELKNFPGISTEFERPINAEITVNTENQTIEETINYIMAQIEPKLALK
jgi:adenylylsulfate kinase